MFSAAETIDPIARTAQPAKDGADKLDDLLARLNGPALAERITDAARLALACHLVQSAHEVKSTVEAEPSAHK